jgi:N-acetylneuraminate synthase
MKTKIIAEIGSVHDGSFGNALRLIELAKQSGADYVKFQMHIAHAETTKHAKSPNYFNEENRFDYFKRTGFTDKQWSKIIKYTKKKKIDFMCSVFSKEAINKLIKLNIKNIKIPSGELNNLIMLNYLKKKNLNIFLSTGMSNFHEIDKAINILKNEKIILMQCTSIYPCPASKVGLNIIDEFKKKYKNIDIGFSDHTLTPTASILSISKGVSYIEKHITFSKKMYGSDAKFAMEPKEFYFYCKYIKEGYLINKSKIDKNNMKNFYNTKNIFEKRVVASKNIKKGKILTLKDLKFKKNNNGIKVSDYKLILKKKLKKNISKDIGFKLTDFVKI